MYKIDTIAVKGGTYECGALVEIWHRRRMYEDSEATFNEQLGYSIVLELDQWLESNGFADQSYLGFFDSSGCMKIGEYAYCTRFDIHREGISVVKQIIINRLAKELKVIRDNDDDAIDYVKGLISKLDSIDLGLLVKIIRKAIDKIEMEWAQDWVTCTNYGTRVRVVSFDNTAEFKECLKYEIDKLNEAGYAKLAHKISDFLSKIDDKDELANVLKSYCYLRNSLKS